MDEEIFRNSIETMIKSFRLCYPINNRDTNEVASFFFGITKLIIDFINIHQ